MHSTRSARQLFAAAALVCACTGSEDSTNPDPGDFVVATPPVLGDRETNVWDDALEAREVNYGQALRGAALKLVGELPTLAEIKFVTEAADQKAAYEAQIDVYLSDGRFARQMRYFWRDTFKMGGTDLDTAPNFAAQLTVEDRSYLELLTATAGTCPTYDGATMTFTAGECVSGAPATVGVLTDPNVMRQFFSNMAFRRARWLQETFACTKFPAEVTEPVDVGGAALYTSPWAFDSIAGAATGGKVDFRDVSAVVCANCHSTMNHFTPLFAHFDEAGMWQADIVVPTPVEGMPVAVLEDYLPVGEGLAWRMGQPISDLTSLGAVMAGDPAIAECAVARVWNYAFGKGDIVSALAIVPSEVIQAQIGAFAQNGHRMKDVFRQVFTSDDYVRF